MNLKKEFCPDRQQAYGVLGVSLGCLITIFVLQETGVFPAWNAYLDNAHWTIADLAAAWLAWIGVRLADPQEKAARAWFARALGCYFIGQVLWDIQVVTGWNPFPAPADLFYLLLGPLALLGFGSVLRIRTAKSERRMAVLDATALSIAASSLILAFYLPKRGGMEWLPLLILVVYPASQLAAACLGAITALTLKLRPSWSWILFLLGLAATAIVWLRWNFLQLENRLEDGTWLNFSFSVVSLACGWGVLKWKTGLSPCTPRWARFCESILVLFPLLLVILTISASALAWTLPDVPWSARLSIGTGTVLVVVLCMARQSILLSERDRLYRAEEQIVKSEVRYKILFETAQDAIFILEGLKFTDCNPRSLEMFGCLRKDIIGHSPVDFSPEYQPGGRYSLDEARDKIQKALDGTAQNFGWSCLRLDGSSFEAEVSLNRIDFVEKPLLQAIVRDVTERKRAQEELRASNELFTSAFEHAAVGIALLNLEGRWMRVNHALCRMTGYSEQDLLSKTCLEITHPEDLEAELAHVKQMLVGDIQTYQMEKRYLHKSGSLVWSLVSVSLLRDRQGAPVHFISQIQDITRRKELECQLLQAQKMEAIGRLSGGVAHDFNNILTIIQMQLALLKSSAPITSEQSDSVMDIEAATARAANLTRQLLAFSRRQTLCTSDLDLNRIVADIGRMLQRIVGEDVHIQLRRAEQPLMIHADSGMMEQVLMNLVVNARDAMPSGGTLLVETRGVDLGPEEVRGSSQAKTGPHVHLRIQDNGDGITPEILPHIFEPFFTTKEVGRGTGLGLSTVHGIVQQHEGWIEVSSRIGEGTTFDIYLPRAGGESTSPVSSSPRPSVHGHETLLLVEDEQTLRAIVKSSLSSLGYTVFAASSGDEALKLWAQHKGSIRLLFTDLIMPGGMGGRDLARRLLQEQPALSVLYTSGYSAEEAGKDLLLKEGENFIAKPYSPEDLAEILRACLRARPSFDRQGILVGA
jgi:PAS domain S-box-containing protein